MSINPELIKKILSDTPMRDSRIHGQDHWRRVEGNALYLAEYSGADRAVVMHFAWLHDCMRQNDGHDSKHGSRAVTYAKCLERRLFDLSDAQLDVLFSACAEHTVGRKVDNPTIATCWDADRLDLRRIGVKPDAYFLFTKEAKRIADMEDYDAIDTFSLAQNNWQQNRK